MSITKKRSIKIGEKVKIISGSQKGIVGNITSINTKKNLVTIDNVLPRIKYIKSQNTGESKKVERQIPIHISNVMLWDNQINSCSRIGKKIINNEKKRYFKKSGNII